MATAPTPQGGQAWAKWLVIAIVVIVVGSGAWYAFGYFATKGSIDAVKDATGMSTAAGAPAANSINVKYCEVICRRCDW